MTGPRSAEGPTQPCPQCGATAGICVSSCPRLRTASPQPRTEHRAGCDCEACEAYELGVAEGRRRASAPTDGNAREILSRLDDWTYQYGAELVPRHGSADTFGDGVRACKARVAGILSQLRTPSIDASPAPVSSNPQPTCIACFGENDVPVFCMKHAAEMVEQRTGSASRDAVVDAARELHDAFLRVGHDTLATTMNRQWARLHGALHTLDAEASAAGNASRKP